MRSSIAVANVFIVILSAWLTGCSEPLKAVSSESTSSPHAVGVVFHDRNGNGVRDPGERGLPNVRVSNQRQIVCTDSKGRWRLPVDDDMTFFVIKPRGWMTPIDPETMLPQFYYTHKPGGSPKLKHGGVAPTGPLPESIDFPLRKSHEPKRFRAIFFGDTQSRNETEIGYMAHDVIEELIGTDAAFGVTLGDIVFDNISLFDLHNRTVALVGIPWYNVIGNHDLNFDAAADGHSDETFERVYGPNYYSFDHGPVHFIVLDDIKWTGATKEKKGGYTGAFGVEQLAFVERDLALVPDDRLVMLMMHIPITQTEDREAMYRLIERRPYALSVSGHTHTQEHRFITRADGWRGPEPHHHVVNVTVCGSWWQGATDATGIPHATMHDGAPNGYSIFTFDGHEASIEFKAARHPASYQMSIHAPDHVPAAQAHETEVVVNVFGGSERSTVEMRLAPDGPWTRMKQERREDPAYVRMKESEKSDRPPTGKPLHKPSKSSHIWVGRLPENPAPGLRLIQVRTTDMYGHKYSASRIVRIHTD